MRSRVYPRFAPSSSCSHRAVSGLVALLTAVVPAIAEEKAPPPCPSPEIRIESEAQSTSMLVPLPGRLVGFAAPRRGESGRDLFVLVAPDDPEDPDSKSWMRRTIDELKAQGVFDSIDANPVRLEIQAVDGEVVESLSVMISGRAGKGSGEAGDCPELQTVTRPTLFEVRPGSPPVLSFVRDDLPEGAGALLAIDVDGDGNGDLLVESNGALLVIPRPDETGNRTPRPLIHDPDLAMRGEEPRRVRFPPEPVAIRSPFDESGEVSPRGHRRGAFYIRHGWADDPAHVRVTGLGELRLYGPGVAAPEWDLLARVPLPVRTNPDPSRLLVTSPQVRTVGQTSAGTLLLAAGPVPYGADRLRTVLIEVGDGKPRAWDAWSHVAEGDIVERSGYLLMDDEPYLWVMSENDESIQLFGGDDDTFRLFRLSPDRTRAGGNAVLEIQESKLPLSGGLEAGWDVNGDGRDDLVLVGQKNTTRIATFFQLGDRRFARSAKKQEIRPNGGPVTYTDLDGDRVPDLMVADRDTYRIHTGLASRSARTIVSDEPRWAASRLLPGKSTPPHYVACHERVLLDLDGDRRPEIVCAGRDGHGRSALKVVRFTRPEG